jgi:hypothetical protein
MHRQTIIALALRRVEAMHRTSPPARLCGRGDLRTIALYDEQTVLYDTAEVARQAGSAVAA